MKKLIIFLIIFNISVLLSQNIKSGYEPYIGWEGHYGPVKYVAYNKEGNILVSSGNDGTVRFWDTNNGTFIKKVRINNNSGNIPFSLSPNGTLLAAPLSSSVGIFDVQADTLLKKIGKHNGWISTVAFSPDGSKIASGGSDKTIKMWDVKTGSLLYTLTGFLGTGNYGTINFVVFSPDGSYLATEGTINRSIMIWDVNTGLPIDTLIGHTDKIISVNYSPDGKMIASCSWDKTIRLWDSRTGNPINALSYDRSFSLLSFSPDGTKLISVSGISIKIWDISTGVLINSLDGHSDVINSLTFSPDGTKIASGSDDCYIIIWNSDDGTILKNFKGHTNYVNSLVISPDETKIASGSRDGTIKIWDAKTLSLLNTLSGHIDRVNSVAFSPDGTKLASGGGDYSIKIWNVNSGSLVYTLKEHTNPVFTVAFSPDGTKLASGSNDNTIKIWDIKTASLINTLKSHWRMVFSIAFSPDGTKLVSGSSDETIKIWDINSGLLLRSIGGYHDEFWSVAFSRDGTKIAGGSLDASVRVLKASLKNGGEEPLFSEGNSIRIWDVNTGDLLNAFNTSMETVVSLAFSPNGLNLVSGSDNKIKIWDFNTGSLLKEIVYDQGDPYSVIYNKKGDKILAGGLGYKNMRIYDVSDLTKTEIEKKPMGFSLNQNYPNPFNPSTVISYTVGANNHSPIPVQLKVYDVLGREVACLVNEKKHAGSYQVKFDGKNLTSGVYFYRLVVSGSNLLQTDTYSEIKKMILIK